MKSTLRTESVDFETAVVRSQIPDKLFYKSKTKGK